MDGREMEKIRQKYHENSRSNKHYCENIMDGYVEADLGDRKIQIGTQCSNYHDLPCKHRVLMDSGTMKFMYAIDIEYLLMKYDHGITDQNFLSHFTFISDNPDLEDYIGNSEYELLPEPKKKFIKDIPIQIKGKIYHVSGGCLLTSPCRHRVGKDTTLGNCQIAQILKNRQERHPHFPY